VHITIEREQLLSELQNPGTHPDERARKPP
jgi:hypothetical protein